MRRLIVNADDFGASTSINRAVIAAHQRGILTTASLMVNGDAADEAICLAKENPKLGVGLHVSLAFGKSALPRSEIPHLVDLECHFSERPASIGFEYFFNPACRRELAREVSEQFRKFRATGLALDHVNGHLHFHMHPSIFGVITRRAAEWNIRQVRLTRDPFWLNARLAKGNWLYRISHAIIFLLLSAWCARKLKKLGIKSTQRVFGLLQHARVDSQFVQRLLPVLPSGDSELYSHPSLDEFKHEFEALVDPKVRATVEREGIQLIRYSDL